LFAIRLLLVLLILPISALLLRLLPNLYLSVSRLGAKMLVVCLVAVLVMILALAGVFMQLAIFAIRSNIYIKLCRIE